MGQTEWWKMMMPVDHRTAGILGIGIRMSSGITVNEHIMSRNNNALKLYLKYYELDIAMKLCENYRI
jgi:hypothetical protein